MSCLRPLVIKNPRYKGLTQKELNDICDDLGVYNYRPATSSDSSDSALVKRPVDYYLTVPCGRCESCLRSYRAQWTTRLLSEYQSTLRSLGPNRQSYFITLTFNPESYSRFTSEGFATAWQLFIDRFRKYYGIRPRYFCVSELGGQTGRFHFHCIFFGCPVISSGELERLWSYGFIYLGYVNEKTCHYVTKYLLKTFSPQSRDSDDPFHFILRVSRGIGFSDSVRESVYQQYKQFESDPSGLMYITIFGVRYPIPRFFRRKSLTPLECYNLLASYFDKPREYSIGKFFKTHDAILFKNRADIAYSRSLALGLSLPQRVPKPRGPAFDPLAGYSCFSDVVSDFMIYSSEIENYKWYDSFANVDTSCPF